MDLFLLLRHVRRDFLMSTAGYLKLGFVELCAKILQIMRNDFKIMRALFANYFCHFLPKTFLGVLYYTYPNTGSTYSMSMGSTK